MFIKLLQITAAYKPAFIYGGPTMSVAKLCEALNDAAIDVEVLATTANGKTELTVPTNKLQVVDGVKVSYFKRLTKDHTHFSPALLVGLRNLILAYKRMNNQDEQKLVIHIHAWWNLVSILSCQLAKFYQIPVVLSPRGMLTSYTLGNRNSRSKAIIHTVIGKKLLGYCHIHATSEKEKTDILKFIQPKQITVIPNLVNLTSKSSIQLTKTDDSAFFNLIYLSRIEEKKGLELLFEALATLTMEWKLKIAGSGDTNYIKSLKHRIEVLGLTSHITWLGHVADEHKFNLLAANDLTILTSYNENFANVVIESLSVGTAVLLSNQVGLADYVAINNLGWITELTIPDIISKIIKSYQDQPTRVSIRNSAPHLIAKDFNSSTLVQRYITLYKHIN